jgi:hypothetical protein
LRTACIEEEIFLFFASIDDIIYYRCASKTVAFLDDFYSYYLKYKKIFGYYSFLFSKTDLGAGYSGQALFQNLVRLLNVDKGMLLVSAHKYRKIPDPGPG